MKIDLKEIKQIISISKKIESNKGFQELLSFYPQGHKTTPFDFLSSLPDIVLIEYDELYEQYKELKDKFITLKRKKAIIDLNQYKESIFNPKEIFNNTDTKNAIIEDTLNIVDLFIGQCNLNIPDFEIIFDSKTQIPFTNGKTINLKFENINKTASYIIHEIGHIIELNDSHLNNECLEFINRKKVFINEYVKTTYDNNGTEVFSTGLQMMFFSPLEFLFKDPEHFYLIYKYIRNFNGQN